MPWLDARGKRQGTQRHICLRPRHLARVPEVKGGHHIRVRATLGAIATLIAVPAFAQDALPGTYKTQPGDEGSFGHVEIYACETSICGVIRKAFDGSGAEIESANIGKKMIWNTEADGGDAYSGGKIWAPDRDKF